MSTCDVCTYKVGCDAKEFTDGCEHFRQIRKEDIMQEMLNMQKELEEKTFGYDFDDMTIEERTAYIKEHSIHLNQEINEALYELPYFKPWKNYEGMTVDQTAVQLRKYKEELVDAFHFFMAMMIAVDMDAEEMRTMYFAKHQENINRQKRGYTHDVSYREER
jgi:dimeric dUTPase (all-alpha-NTP-PPase superfamily)